jgi:hypothetical protein
MLEQDGNWQFLNVTQQPGEKIAGPVTSSPTQNGPNGAGHVAVAM